MVVLRKALVLACLILAVPAVAEPASDAAISAFVDNHSAVTRLGKIARWEEGVCPGVTGLPASFSKYILKRVRDVATAAGAPVNADESCKANIDIVFTTKPQGLLDSIRVKDPFLLGYFDSSTQADEMAKVSRTIQAWHATQTVDARGHALVDSRLQQRRSAAWRKLPMRRTAWATGWAMACIPAISTPSSWPIPASWVITRSAPWPITSPCWPWRNPRRRRLAAELPSILDITSAQCHKDAPAKTMTAADTGYLRGLYQAEPGASLRTQKDGIAFRVKDALAGH